MGEEIGDRDLQVACSLKFHMTVQGYSVYQIKRVVVHASSVDRDISRKALCPWDEVLTIRLRLKRVRPLKQDASTVEITHETKHWGLIQ